MILDNVAELAEVTRDKNSRLTFTILPDMVYADVSWTQYNNKYSVRNCLSKQMYAQLLTEDVSSYVFKDMLKQVEYAVGKNEYEAA